ncbi:hypothetical protein [Methylobacterium sp. D54C]
MALLAPPLRREMPETPDLFRDFMAKSDHASVIDAPGVAGNIVAPPASLTA